MPTSPDAVAFFQPQGSSSVIWNPEKGVPIAEFRNRRFDTADPAVIELLDSMGYPRIDEDGPVSLHLLTSTKVRVGDHIFKFPNRPESLAQAKNLARSYAKDIRKAEAEEEEDPPNSPQTAAPVRKAKKDKVKRKAVRSEEDDD
jgi:hypothetical protein